MASVDVTVRGGGIFGLSIAWACLKRGATVRVIESVALGAGSSGGLVGALSPHVPEAWNAKKAFQLESLLMAADWWGAVEAAAGLPSGYARLGRLQPLADDRAVETARRREDEATNLWQGRAVWRVIRATGGEWEPHTETGWLGEDTLSARLSPRMGLAALVAALRAGGADVVLGAGEEAGAVVHATGVAGLEDLSRVFGTPLGSGVKGQALSLRFEARDRPQLFVDGLHIVPHADGTVAIGSTSEAAWTEDGPDAQLDGLLAKAIAAVPALAGAEVLTRWAGVRPKAASRAPLLGAWPGRAEHFVANGGFKIGFGMAPKVAEVMADLVLEGREEGMPPEFRLEALLQKATARREVIEVGRSNPSCAVRPTSRKPIARKAVWLSTSSTRVCNSSAGRPIARARASAWSISRLASPSPRWLAATASLPIYSDSGFGVRNTQATGAPIIQISPTSACRVSASGVRSRSEDGGSIRPSI